jgi:general secretion pathway protein F
VMDRLAIQADQEEALRSKVQSSLAYPIFIGVVGFGTIVFLLTFVMPRLIKMFGSFGGELPAPTKLLMAVSGLLAQQWFWGGVVLFVVGGLLLFRVLGDQGRFMIDRVQLGLPVMGKLIRQLELARFSRAFGLLLGHGIPVLRATEIAIPVVTNRVLRKEFQKLPGALRDGSSLAISLQALALSAPLFVNTVAVGEEGGRVAEALDEVAQYYEQETERTLGMLSALLEPAIILVVGGVVGFIVMAVLLPVFEMSVMTR